MTNDQDPDSQKNMNHTQKALCFSGLFLAVLTAVIISAISDARERLEKAVLDNARQDVKIAHNSDSYDDLALQMRELMGVAIGTNNAVIRVETKLDGFESGQ